MYEFMNKKCFFQTHLDICMCGFMNKKWFSGLTVSRWPQAGGICTDSVICSVTNGVLTADSVCAHLLRRL